MFKIMYYGGLLLGIAGAAAMLFIFIKLDIFHSFMEVSGLDAKIAIKKMKEQKGTIAKEHKEETTSDKEYTEKIRTSSIIGTETDAKTSLLEEQDLNEVTERLDEETTILEDSSEFVIDEVFIDVHTEERII